MKKEIKSTGVQAGGGKKEDLDFTMSGLGSQRKGTIGIDLQQITLPAARSTSRSDKSRKRGHSEATEIMQAGRVVSGFWAEHLEARSCH